MIWVSKLYFIVINFCLWSIQLISFKNLIFYFPWMIVPTATTPEICFLLVHQTAGLISHNFQFSFKAQRSFLRFTLMSLEWSKSRQPFKRTKNFSYKNVSHLVHPQSNYLISDSYYVRKSNFIKATWFRLDFIAI